MDSVLRSSYRLYILGTMYTYFSTKRPRTNINFTDIINAHGRFKSRQEVVDRPRKSPHFADVSKEKGEKVQ